MRRIFTKSITAAIVASMLISLLTCAMCLFGCSAEKKTDSKPKTEHKQSVKATTGIDDFCITYYWGPHGEQAIDETFWQAVAECGFNSVPLEALSTEYNKIALDLLEKYGLTCSALMDERITAITGSLDDMTTEEIDAVVKDVVDDYKDYDIIKGWWVYDEPHRVQFEGLANLQDSFKRIDPERTTFTTLFGSYAKIGMDYNQYVKEYAEIVNPDYLVYDNYTFIKDGLRGDFFSNLEWVRNVAVDTKKDFYPIVQLTKIFDYQDIYYSQLMWETNMALAYGAKGISYFMFILEEYHSGGDLCWEDSCMSYTGEKYQHYYDVQKLNKETAVLGRELYNKNSVAVFHISKKLEEGCSGYTSYGSLGKVSGKKFTVGFFDDGSFMLVNEAYMQGVPKNTLTLEEVTENLEYFDIESAEWKPYEIRNEDGLYEISLDSGAAILLYVAE